MFQASHKYFRSGQPVVFFVRAEDVNGIEVVLGTVICLGHELGFRIYRTVGEVIYIMKFKIPFLPTVHTLM